MGEELDNLKDENRRLKSIVKSYEDRDSERTKYKRDLRKDTLKFLAVLIIIAVWLNSIGYTWNDFIGRH